MSISLLDIDLRKASKSFATHFSCGSSVTGDDEIVVQGDVCDEVVDYILEQWPEVMSMEWVLTILIFSVTLSSLPTTSC